MQHFRQDRPQAEKEDVHAMVVLFSVITPGEEAQKTSNSPFVLPNITLQTVLEVGDLNRRIQSARRSSGDAVSCCWRTKPLAR
jgi:hypothetical protein